MSRGIVIGDISKPHVRDVVLALCHGWRIRERRLSTFRGSNWGDYCGRLCEACRTRTFQRRARRRPRRTAGDGCWCRGRIGLNRVGHSRPSVTVMVVIATHKVNWYNGLVSQRTAIPTVAVG